MNCALISFPLFYHTPKQKAIFFEKLVKPASAPSFLLLTKLLLFSAESGIIVAKGESFKCDGTVLPEPLYDALFSFITASFVRKV